MLGIAGSPKDTWLQHSFARVALAVNLPLHSQQFSGAALCSTGAVILLASQSTPKADADDS